MNPLIPHPPQQLTTNAREHGAVEPDPLICKWQIEAMELRERRAAAEKRAEEAEAEAAACIDFLNTEMSWEFFRSERVHKRGTPEASLSLQNARKLEAFLKETGHARALLQRLETADGKVQP